MDAEGIISFCCARFEQTGDFIENTDSGRIVADFPRSIHRLRHRVSRLRHALQFGTTEVQLQSSAQGSWRNTMFFGAHVRVCLL
jgi:hypothetical protein